VNRDDDGGDTIRCSQADEPVARWMTGILRPLIQEAMTVTPEYAEEERLRQQEERLREQSEGLLPDDREDAPEREIAEFRQQEREALYLDAESNEAHAPAGTVCERCGTPITADQDARLRADGGWVHEVCPLKS
jgi:hypothetical protein